ncbi:CcmD family protein [Marinoscillum furvescens]|uniref:CcmD family protein n=1 Tax=Marinoscillum furvescens DSM 4134 TaxID=1122208 RepID=A0A3D9L897_MARFU|nr:CcmD family protein [Marinoscillum furvescens]REE01705.1 hypothetical protein C7460_103222 [Marinoscillum furvescens DSM 4134]
MIELRTILSNLLIQPAVFVNNVLVQIPMADSFRSEGKIYVVVGIVLILLVGFFYYLLRVDRKVKKLEDEINDRAK